MSNLWPRIWSIVIEDSYCHISSEYQEQGTHMQNLWRGFWGPKPVRDKLFSYEGNLKKHIHTIHVLSLLMISIVNVAFSNAGHLNKHIYAIHKSQKEHK